MNLIYQYLNREHTSGSKASVKNMKAYANRIGADHLFEHMPQWVTNLGSYSPHYGCFKPVFDKNFDKYDNILYVDIDVFAIDGLTDNIFDNANFDIGVCTEQHTPKIRKSNKKGNTFATEEKWGTIVQKEYGIKLPRDKDNLLKVYNSGVILFTRAGIEKARKNFVPFIDYVNLIKRNNLPVFYTADQNYLHAMLMKVDYKELDNGWNSFVHYLREPANKVNDTRTKNTKLVHIQLSMADYFTEEQLYRITNLPVEKWKL